MSHYSDNGDPKIANSKTTLQPQNRSRLPVDSKFLQMMKANWQFDTKPKLIDSSLKSAAKIHRDELWSNFSNQTLVIDAGSLKVRSNDTDYKFRPASAFSHLTGLGQDYDPEAKLVFYPTNSSYTAVLYIRPPYDLTSDKFYSNSYYGEFWIGSRPKLIDFANATGLTTKSLSDYAKDIKSQKFILTLQDPQLLEVTDQLRLIKLPEEIKQLKKAVAVTKKGFEAVIKQLDKAKLYDRAERYLEGVFHQQAITLGNQEGYETIVAAGHHATILHWIRNTGQIKDGELLLLDAGCEVDSLYTADITRTMPISGSFSTAQKDIYNLVLKAANAGFTKAKPGNKFIDVHNAAMREIAQGLIDLGILKISLDEVLDKQLHRRWMCHGTSHHLGIDVHDCDHVKKDGYINGTLKEGMVFTIEPGLYFKTFDNLIPDIYKGIGIRIEDDVLITKNGCENLSQDFPRDAQSVENWVINLKN
ncbi:MAG: aminopeptidase P family protein [Bifidobacteriaceae bacterium]|jgi:Xaa-Pro aminopeptidase|nr:aminopeptidase P family protein [Bifidobacteriaceae bacterium]